MKMIDVRQAATKPCHALTIAGEPGVGKTVLAATFPQAVVIRVEDGASSIAHFADTAMTEVIEHSNQVNDWLEYLRTQKHKRKTVVIDSITALDAMIEAEIVESDKRATSLQNAFGGYGAGSRALADRMRKIRVKCQRLMKDRGMNVVFVAQSVLRSAEPEDDIGYDQLTIRMNSRSLPPFQDDVDLVGFLRLVKRVEKLKGEDRGQATSDGGREIICHATAATVAKNRFGNHAAAARRIRGEPAAGGVEEAHDSADAAVVEAARGGAEIAGRARAAAGQHEGPAGALTVSNDDHKLDAQYEFYHELNARLLEQNATLQKIFDKIDDLARLMNIPADEDEDEDNVYYSLPPAEDEPDF